MNESEQKQEMARRALLRLGNTHASQLTRKQTRQPTAYTEQIKHVAALFDMDLTRRARFGHLMDYLLGHAMGYTLHDTFKHPREADKQFYSGVNVELTTARVKEIVSAAIHDGS